MKISHIGIIYNIVNLTDIVGRVRIIGRTLVLFFFEHLLGKYHIQSVNNNYNKHIMSVTTDKYIIYRICKFEKSKALNYNICIMFIITYIIGGGGDYSLLVDVGGGATQQKHSDVYRYY